MKIKKGDKVKIIYGKEKGKESVVEKSLPKLNSVIVSGVNVVKKHLKKKDRNSGGIVEVTKKIPVSRVQLICPKCSKPTKVGYFITDGKKLRQCKKCKEVL
ncbi:MAG: 50S ribosomal protein L24 [bacterium]